MKYLHKMLLLIFSIIIITSCSDKENNSISEISLDKTDLELMKGESYVFFVTIEPVDPIDQKILWESSNPDIATVDVNGKVLAISVGEAYISVISNDISASCRLIVKGIPVEEINLNRNSLDLKIGESTKLEVIILPENAENKNVTWTSSDENVVQVDAEGVVKAISVGEAEVKAELDNKFAICEIIVSEVSNIKSGDYYYSDGSYSSNLDTEKTPIGIVFWVGDPGENDSSLRRDHPDCVNGLVVSLGGEKGGGWQPKYRNYDGTVGEWIVENTTDYFTITTKAGPKDNLNKIVGYNNTKAIELFNAANANLEWPVETVKSVVEYRQEVPAPSSSSDWYSPSAKELSLLCTGKYDGNIWFIQKTLVEQRDFINERLETISGTTQLTVSYYWSCTELDATRTFDVYFNSGFLDNTVKSNRSGIIRSVLAF